MKLLKTLCLCVGLAFATGACEPLKQVNWPDKVQCLPPVSDLLAAVADVLFNDGNVETQLKKLGEEHGFDAVICAVESLRKDWTKPGAAASPERSRALSRAEAFLVKAGTDVE